ncbi:hypothetical protein VKT23_012863 [Stygiomarasmius scandens]|uniref:Uncharacterized protein n=1 Tax=Marasmiellus scandens TaxID=2682957 RepID=A0ABR1J7A1_9AGAR
MTGVDEMVLGFGDERLWDDVCVEDKDDGNIAGFQADIQIVGFQKRMKVLKEVGVEFVAKGAFSTSRF